MSALSWGLSLPYQQAARWQRRTHERWATLPRPTISVGNLAFGGRGKTPITAAIAKHALALGLRPAILTRGYGGSLRRTDAPQVLEGGPGPAWLQPVAQEREVAGEEACWLAASCPGVPVGVHPDRSRSAAQILTTQTVDLFVLDDGFQTKLQRDVDLVLLDALLDPPFVRQRGPQREGVAALDRASALGVFTGGGSELPEQREEGPDGGTSLATLPQFPLKRVFGGLRRLSDGADVAASDAPSEVLTATAVGQPESVLALLTDAGIQARYSLKLKDHSRPSPRQLRRLRSSPVPVLMTEKDALSWGRQSAGEGLVLQLKLEGAEALAAWAVAELGL